MSNRLKQFLLVALFSAFTAMPVASAAIVDPVVDGNSLSAEIDLGGVNAELSITFEQVVGLSAENLGLSAELVDPLDTALLARLVGGVDTSLVSGFPVLIRVQPPAGGGLGFAGVATVELYTHDLQYTAGTPLRLFSAPDGGTFRDITASMSSGSYRVRGSKGTFSEFLIVADLRSAGSVVDGKFDALADLLYAHSAAIDATTFSELESQLTAAESAWDGGDVVNAIAGIEAFETAAQTAGSGDLPDVWRSARDLDNVAGQLRAAADTLRFSLTLASNGL